MILAAALVVAAILAFGGEKASSAINYASSLTSGNKIAIPENPNWQNELSGAIIDTETQPNLNEGGTEETITNTVSRSLISNYLALKQSGVLDEESAQKLVDQTSDYVTSSGTTSVSAPRLNIIPDNGKQTVSDYGERLGMIFKTNRPSEEGNEIAILEQSLASSDGEKLKEIQRPIDFYEKVAEELIKMPVPQTFVKAHTDTVAGIKTVAAGLRESKEILNDPVRGLVGLQTYRQGGELALRAIQASVLFIKQSGIDYKQGSGGYYLLYGL